MAEFGMTNAVIIARAILDLEKLGIPAETIHKLFAWLAGKIISEWGEVK